MDNFTGCCSAAKKVLPRRAQRGNLQRSATCSATAQAVRMKAVFGSSPDAYAGIVKNERK
jgi:hypothetical protein